MNPLKSANLIPTKILGTLILCSIILTACYKRQTGCLDPLAANFMVTADDPCDGCCQDPILSLTIRHLTGDYLVSPDSTLINDFNQEYRILNFVYYLSGFELLKSDGTKLTVQENLSFNGTTGGTITTPDDFGIYRRTNITTNLGTIRQYGTFTQINFLLGINDEWLQLSPIDLPLLHPLNDSLSVRTSDGKLIHQRLTIAKGDAFKDTLTYNITGNGSATLFSLDTIFTNAIGTNINMVIKADYNRWLKNTDLTQTAENIEKQILENSKHIFSVN